MSTEARLAVVGATGVVGREIVRLLDERYPNLPEPLLIASRRSMGEGVEFHGHDVTVRPLDDVNYDAADIWILAANSQVADSMIVGIQRSGGRIIDLSERLRQDHAVPLIVPELNISEMAGCRMVACPGAAATMLCLVLKPLAVSYAIKGITACSFEPVSVRGNAGVNELERQIKDLMTFQEPRIKVFNHQIAFNVLPQCGLFGNDGGNTDYEQQTSAEIKRLLGDDDLRVDFSAAVVPVFYGHGISVSVDFSVDPELEIIRNNLQAAPGVKVEDAVGEGIYPMPVFVAGQNDCLVGRIREVKDYSTRLSLWIAADNVRRGAAMNAVGVVDRMLHGL